MTRFQKIDSEGYLKSDEGLRLEASEYTQEFFQNLLVNPSGRIETKYQDAPILVESYDAPLVARNIEVGPDGQVDIEIAYGYKFPLQKHSFWLDEWDRFHSYTGKKIPVVFSRQAQAQLFNLADEFEDDSIVLKGKKISTPMLFDQQVAQVNSQFWQSKYEGKQTPWSLNRPHTCFFQFIDRLKLPRLRILVLGSGHGHDAAELAQRGHIVTGLDFSSEATRLAEENFKGLQDLEFVARDAFDSLNSKSPGSFDVVFDHTFFCAIPLIQRAKYAKMVRKWLAPDGHLLANYFVMENLESPPFGATESELYTRLKNDFSVRLWERSRSEVPGQAWRLGCELFVYAQVQKSN